MLLGVPKSSPITVTKENLQEVATLIRGEVYSPEFTVAEGGGHIFVIFLRQLAVVLDVMAGDRVILNDNDDIVCLGVRGGRSFEAFVMNKAAAAKIDFDANE